LFILCCDRPDFARQAIQSAIGQTVDCYQIVISDNSTDRSVEALVRSEFPGLEYRRRARHLSVLEHFNQCLTEAAAADYFCLFHDDDVLSPRYVEAILEAISQYPDAAAIGTNAWMFEDPKPLDLAFETIGRTHFVHDARQLAAHYYSRHQLGIAPFPGYTYSSARISGLRFDVAGGKYSDVAWLLRVTARGRIVWLAEPLMTYRLHASNDGRKESIADRLKLFAFFKSQVSTLGEGLIQDFRFFLYKKLLELDRRNLCALSPSRRRKLRAYLTRYRFVRLTRLDHHVSLLRKAGVRLARRFRRQTFDYPHGVA
jgi:glycosyltransferase involved in cell wall biosynthesis